jgi:hypothetical protein
MEWFLVKGRGIIDAFIAYLNVLCLKTEENPEGHLPPCLYLNP